MYRIYYYILLTAEVLLLQACGLFTPQKPDNPTILDQTDFLNLKYIMKYTNGQFHFQDYDQLFNTGFSYADAANSIEAFNKADMLARFTTIRNKIKKIEWSFTDTLVEELDKNKQYNTLKPRKYTLVLNKIPDVKDTIYRGEAVFDLSFTNQLDWVIVRWRDKNTIDNNARSFFNPRF